MASARAVRMFDKLGRFIEHPLVRLLMSVTPVLFTGLFTIVATISVYAGQSWFKSYLDKELSENPRISMQITATAKMEESFDSMTKTVAQVVTDQAANGTATNALIIRVAEIEKSAQIRLAILEKEALLKSAEQDKRLSLLEQDMARKREDDRLWQAEVLKLLKKQ